MKTLAQKSTKRRRSSWKRNEKLLKIPYTKFTFSFFYDKSKFFGESKTWGIRFNMREW